MVSSQSQYEWLRQIDDASLDDPNFLEARILDAGLLATKHGIGLDQRYGGVVVLFAAIPTGANAYIFAVQYPRCRAPWRWGRCWRR